MQGAISMNNEEKSATWQCLVVDDEEELRELLQMYVEDMPAKIDVDSAENGAVALELCKKKYYDFIICDLKMPIVNGLTLLKELRQRKIASCFIIVTAFGDKDSVLTSLKNGAYDFILKPFTYDQLHISLDAILGFLHHKATVEGQIKFILKDHGMPEDVISEVFDFNESILKERYVSLSKQIQSIS
jgi:YesN/AraC family two-component response regulator